MSKSHFRTVWGGGYCLTMKIIILTPTYNRKKRIRELYNSLLSQSSYAFKWLVIDDGSNDGTDFLFEDITEHTNPFVIDYYKKENGGKSRAINFGFDKIDDADFVIIIDDDEVLYRNAVQIVAQYVEKYIDSDCVGIEFLRDINHKPIANYMIKGDFTMGIRERKKKNLVIDGYTGYFWRKISSLRFPEFSGEKYVGPGVLQMMAEDYGTWLWPCESLGNTDYYEDGLTKQGRKLRVKNPRGMTYYCVLHQHKNSGFFVRFKYSIMGFAYLRCSNMTKADFEESGIMINRLMRVAYIPSCLVAWRWRRLLLSDTNK